MKFESNERKGEPSGNHVWGSSAKFIGTRLWGGRCSIFEGGDDGHVRVERVRYAQCCEAGFATDDWLKVTVMTRNDDDERSINLLDVLALGEFEFLGCVEVWPHQRLYYNTGVATYTPASRFPFPG